MPVLTVNLQVSKPFFAMLHKWLFSGELYDPHSEFFVAVDPQLADVQYMQPRYGLSSGDEGFSDQFIDLDDLSREHQSGQKLWEGKFIFRKEMLPAFVGETFGRKVRSQNSSLLRISMTLFADILHREELEFHSI